MVTGAGSGIGRATAVALGQRGLKVICVGRRRASLEATVLQLPGAGQTVVADVGTDAGVAAIAEGVGEQRISALVHAAGVDGVVSLDTTDRATFDHLVATNLAGPFFLTKALASRLGDASGVVFVGSIAATHGRPAHAAYAATKAGLVGLTTNLAAELAPRVRVNCVVPGATDTPMLARGIAEYVGSMTPEEAQHVEAAEMARVLLRRLGDPAEVAATIVHLALDATYSTGSLVTVDGGISAR